MSTPNWSPAASGTTAQAAQVNQFFGTHATTYMYQGAQQVANGITGTTHATDCLITAPTSSIPTNTGAAAQWIDQPFTTAASQTTITRVALCFFNTGTAADTTVALYTDNAGNPNTLVAGTTVNFPSDFVNPIYTSTTGTTYGTASVTDSGGTIPIYISDGAVNLGFYGFLAVTGSHLALINSFTTPTASIGTTTWTGGQPSNGIAYSLYPLISIPLNATGLTAATKYHIVVGGTASTTNFNNLLTTANVTGEVAQTGTSAAGPWTTTTTKTLHFGVFANTPGNPPSRALRNTWEDAGARWTSYQYIIANNITQSPAAQFISEYTGTMRSRRRIDYATANPGREGYFPLSTQ